jgi:hypothetical protein
MRTGIVLFVVLAHDRRGVLRFNVTDRLTAAWTGRDTFGRRSALTAGTHRQGLSRAAAIRQEVAEGDYAALISISLGFAVSIFGTVTSRMPSL